MEQSFMKKDTDHKLKMNSFEKMRVTFLATVRQHFMKGDFDLIQKKSTSFTADETDKRLVLDQVLRDHLLEQLSSCKTTKEDNVGLWEKYVNYCIQLCQRGLCNATMPVVLLGDVFDALTLEQCERLFAYVEDNVAIWKEPLFFTPCKNNLLRMCNDLLRRLSRSQNTVFCGRILLFLAKFFPFSERSGLNIVSEFNLDNITEYGNDGPDSLKQIIAEEENEKDDDFKADIKINIDYNLYSKFWSLQDFFRNPNQCYNKVHWKTFSSHANSVLSAFSSFKLDGVSVSKRQKSDPPNNQDLESKMDVDNKSTSSCSSSQIFFAKFLTNQKLLELQLSDSNFRRYVLLQFLMLFQYLESQVKFKPESYELKQDQMEWVKETTDSVYKLINETPPDGPDFVTAVKHILKREEQWNNWKNEGCKEFQKPLVPQESVEETGINERKKPLRPRKRGRSLGDALQESITKGKTFMGNAELTKLWNVCPDNLDACRAKERDFLPSLDCYFEEAIEQADPNAMVEDSYKKINDGNFGWRALRLLARRSPHFFTPSSNNISKLPEYLETMIKKIAKERPSTGTPVAPVEESRAEILDARTEENGGENEQDEEELLKTMKGVEEDHKEDDGDGKKSLAFTRKLLDALAVAVASDWRKLALKLTFPEDMIDVLVSQHSDETTRARKLLEMYAENDEDACPENLAYTLEGLGMLDGANLINNADQSQ